MSGGDLRCSLSDNAAAFPTAYAGLRVLSVEIPPGKIALPVLIALVIASQEAVTVRLLINVATSKPGIVATGATAEKVRTPGVVALSSASVVGARVQTIFVALVVRTPTINIVAIGFRLINRRDLVAGIPVLMPIAPAILVAITVPVAVAISIPIAIFVAVAISIPIAIFVAVAIFIPIAIFVAVAILVPVAVPASITSPIAVSVARGCYWRTFVSNPIAPVPATISLKSSTGLGPATIASGPSTVTPSGTTGTLVSVSSI